MPGSESYLLDASWLFFAAWSLVVMAVVVAAFAPDLLPRQSGEQPTLPSPGSSLAQLKSQPH